MAVLVTGGTGFVGRQLVEKLIKNHKVIVFARREDEEIDKKTNLILGDIRNLDEVKTLFAENKIDTIYHLAANLDETDPNMYRDNIRGTRNLVQVAKESGVRRIIAMSSSGVLGETTEPAKEDMPYNPKTRYEESRIICEKIILESGIPYTIIRASIVIGPNDIWLNIINAAKKGYPIIGSGKNHFHLAYIKDVIDLLILTKANIKAKNQIFHIATTDTPTYEEVYSMINKELRIKMTRTHIPVRIAYLLSSIHNLKAKIQGKKPKLTMRRSSIDRLIRNRIISIEKAKQMLKFEPKYDTRKAIKETVKYLKNRGIL